MEIGTCRTCKYWVDYQIGTTHIRMCVSQKRDLKKNPKTGILLCWEPKRQDKKENEKL